ncbi:hypothetical protein IF655_26930 [Streptomyces sp. DSM 110735]|uniref:hypothetical protein n=1 Tax=Streptomyces sp. DSM 110735 TaxID=2775031 RepID=UPI0018F27FCD|nr:hypothetical protein [Streptomyces sp. DSM 110735]MBJ7906925.1 hypothetical protein [Streptomyces sp. DSM 110735]
MPPVPPMPSSPPPAPPDPLRAAAVGLLNLSGLGLGYVLLRRWFLAAACWVATAVLLLVALPADPDGVPAGALAGYVVVLVLAAAHGAFTALRTRLTWPSKAPLALALGVLLLAVPTAGTLWYRDAREEAVQQALLDRLHRADETVTAAGRLSFTTSRSDYRDALDVYRDLAVHHAGSRAAGQVPDSLRTYYRTVGAPYASGDYCGAIEPLKYLRTVPQSLPENRLGSLAQWPDDRLATSLYDCGATALSGDGEGWVEHFGDLLGTFPDSGPAAKVAPAVESAVAQAQKDVGGKAPCTAVERLRELNTRALTLSNSAGSSAAQLTASANRAKRSGDAGAYDCGIDQYKDGQFSAAQKTMEDYAARAKGAKRDRARKIAIGAEVAQTVPAAGKKLPTTASGGGISVTVKNDSPDDITVLYTGPVTGSFTLKGCGNCRAYSFADTIRIGFKPCDDSGKNYPKRTISLPVGTTYFVHKPNGTSTATPASDTAKIRSGYIYTECAYTTRTFGN